MEIKLNTNIDTVGRVGASQTKKVETKVADEGPAFSQSAALDGALRQTPDVRSEVVTTAKNLVANSSYPPTETIKKIATLLAKNISVES